MGWNYVEIGTDGYTSSSSKSISKFFDESSENGSHELNQPSKDHHSLNETPTSTIYIICPKFGYKE